MNANDKQVSKLINNIKMDKYYELMNEGKKVTRNSLVKNDVYESTTNKDKKAKNEKIMSMNIDKKVMSEEELKNISNVGNLPEGSRTDEGSRPPRKFSTNSKKKKCLSKKNQYVPPKISNLSNKIKKNKKILTKSSLKVAQESTSNKNRLVNPYLFDITPYKDYNNILNCNIWFELAEKQQYYYMSKTSRKFSIENRFIIYETQNRFQLASLIKIQEYKDLMSIEKNIIYNIIEDNQANKDTLENSESLKNIENKENKENIENKENCKYALTIKIQKEEDEIVESMIYVNDFYLVDQVFLCDNNNNNDNDNDKDNDLYIENTINALNDLQCVLTKFPLIDNRNANYYSDLEAKDLKYLVISLKYLLNNNTSLIIKNQDYHSRIKE